MYLICWVDKFTPNKVMPRIFMSSDNNSKDQVGIYLVTVKQGNNIASLKVIKE